MDGLGIIDRPVTDETLATAGYESPTRGYFVVTLANRRRNARSHVRLYRDRDGTPYVRDRLHGRRDVVAIRYITIDGQPLECGCAVLAAIDDGA